MSIYLDNLCVIAKHRESHDGIGHSSRRLRAKRLLRVSLLLKCTRGPSGLRGDSCLRATQISISNSIYGIAFGSILAQRVTGSQSILQSETIYTQTKFIYVFMVDYKLHCARCE